MRQHPKWRSPRLPEAFRSRCLLAALSILGLPTMAQAQTPSTLPEWTYSAGTLLRNKMMPSVPEWSVFTGISAAYSPWYDGANEHHWQGGPTVDIHYRDIAFISTGEGIGVNLLRGEKYRAGTAITFDLGRRAKDADESKGLGNINPAPELKFFAEYMIFPAVLRVDARRGFGGHNGWIADLGAYMPVYGTKKFFVFIGPSVTFADDKYMQNYFGVNATQSANSGYATYTAHAGLKSASAGGSATWLVTDHWLVNVIAGGQRLLGDAADSPLAHDRIQYGTTMTVGYNF